MPDKTITQLDPITTVLPGTLLVVVDDPTGTPINKKATVSQLPPSAPAGHHVTHETGGADAITSLSGAVITSGTVADARHSTNVPLKNAANIFTVNQRVTATRPAWELLFPGNVALGRVSQNTLASRIDVTSNLSYDGTDLNADDTSKPSAHYSQSDGAHYFNTFPAGANPRTAALAAQMSIDAAGLVTIFGSLTVAGVNLLAHQARHRSGGADPVDVKTLAGYPGDGSLFLSGMGAFAIPAVNPNTAYKNVDNGFTVGQTVASSVVVSGSGYAELRLTDTAQAANAKIFRVLNYQGLFQIWPADDAANPASLALTLTRAGHTILGGRLQIGSPAAPPAMSASYPAWRSATGPVMECVTGDNSQWAGVRAGFVITMMAGTQLADLSTYGGIYPGRVDVAGYQTSWYLASHGSYGLYANTGLYLAGSLTAATNVTCTTLYATAGLASHAGVGGVFQGNAYNFEWNGSGTKLWIDTFMAGIITVTSDARVKRDFTPLSARDSLDKLLRLRPGTFYFRRVLDTSAEDPDLHLGLLAQEVTEVAPELTRNTGMPTPFTPDGLWQVNYLEMIPMLVAAIQELEHRLAHVERMS